MAKDNRERIHDMHADNQRSTGHKPADTQANQPPRQDSDIPKNPVKETEERSTRVNENLNTTRVNQAGDVATIHEGGGARARVNERIMHLQDPTQTDFDTDDDDDNKKANLKRENADTNKIDEYDGKLFEEGDIIDWMFRHIIVEGMNYIGKKVVGFVAYGAAYVTDKTVDGVSYVISETYKDSKAAVLWLANGGKHPDDDTTKLFAEVAELHGKGLEKSAEALNPVNQKILEKVGEMIRNGETEKLKCFSPETLAVLSTMTPEQKAAIFSPEQMPVMAQNMLATISAMKQFTANRAASGVMNEKMNGKNVGDAKKMYERLEAEARLDFIVHLREAAKNGGNIFEAGRTLVSLSEQEIATVRETVENGMYQERFTKYNRPNLHVPENEAGIKLEKIIFANSAVRDQYRNKATIDNFAEEIVEHENIRRSFEDEIRNDEASRSSREQNNNKRRENARRVAANCNNPYYKAPYAAPNTPVNLAKDNLKYAPAKGGRS